MVTVAGGRPSGGSVDLAVGDGNAVGGTVTKDDVLTSNQVGSNMVDPDKIGTINGDGVSSPDVCGVDIREADVLNNNVLGVAHDPDTLALNNALAALKRVSYTYCNMLCDKSQEVLKISVTCVQCTSWPIRRSTQQG